MSTDGHDDKSISGLKIVNPIFNANKYVLKVVSPPITFHTNILPKTRSLRLRAY